MKLGKNFKYYRELNGYSQEDVAQNAISGLKQTVLRSKTDAMRSERT